MRYHAVTISGLICSGKSSLFKDLVQRINWPSYSASHFFREWCREHKAPLFAADMRPDILTREVDQGMRQKLLEGGKIILEGWLAGFIAQGIPGVLKVILICQDEERIIRFAKRENVSLEVAGKEIKIREENLFNKWKRTYGREDFFDPKYYDLVIDATCLKTREVLDLVLEKIGVEK